MSALDNERDTGLRPANTERYDLLVGREKRLHKAYRERREALLARIPWIDNAPHVRRADYPRLTLAQRDTEVCVSLGRSLDEARAAFGAWLAAREELAAPEGKGR